jgi:NAD(P)-dependent dehydrogenase (short-subunit alcohol dehydrogenase family)
MDFSLNGKVAVVTGATKGMGRAIAGEFANQGAKLTIVSRTPADCIRVAEELHEAGAEAIAMSADISGMADVGRIIDETLKQFGRIDILVNNAGVARTKPAFEVTEDDWNHVQDIDSKSVFFLCQKAGSFMRENGGGKIINVASIGGIVGQKGLAPYCAAKGGVIQMTRTLALEWAKYNIQINAVCPGYVRTPMNDSIIDNKEIVDSIVRRIPMRRFGTPEEIAGICVFLASDASSYVTGQAICVDGGMVAE